ncbi:MAG: hypothetical protein PSV18_00860 [Methylobacter sp.]|nr:hypothetical protein [Candidatus Methylobacter titanis]
MNGFVTRRWGVFYILQSTLKTDHGFIYRLGCKNQCNRKLLHRFLGASGKGPDFGDLNGFLGYSRADCGGGDD